MSNVRREVQGIANFLYILNPGELRSLARQIDERLKDTGDENDSEGPSESTVRPIRNNSPVQAGEGSNDAPVAEGDSSSSPPRLPGDGATARIAVSQNMQFRSIGDRQTPRRERGLVSNSPVQSGEGGNDVPLDEGDENPSLRRVPDGAIARLTISQDMRFGSIGERQTARTE